MCYFEEWQDQRQFILWFSEADYVIPLKFPFTSGRFHGGKVSVSQSVRYWAKTSNENLIAIVIQIHLMITCWQIVIMWGSKGYLKDLFLDFFCLSSSFFFTHQFKFLYFLDIYWNHLRSTDMGHRFLIILTHSLCLSVYLSFGPSDQPQRNNLLITYSWRNYRMHLINQFPEAYFFIQLDCIYWKTFPASLSN